MQRTTLSALQFELPDDVPLECKLERCSNESGPRCFQIVSYPIDFRQQGFVDNHQTIT